VEPGSAEWWASRPIWIAILYAVLVPVTLLLSTFERRTHAADAKVPATARLVGGAALLCLGIALLALFGFGTTPLPHLDVAALAMVIVGAGISGLLPGFR
jgi:hypothetical protein